MFMTTTNNKPFAFTINRSSSTKLQDRKGYLRTVVFTLDHVAAPGCDWTKAGPRRVVELTSFDDGAVEVYIQDPTDGIMMHQGTVRMYAPASAPGRGGCRITSTFRAAWFAKQKSAAARRAFEASCEAWS